MTPAPIVRGTTLRGPDGRTLGHFRVLGHSDYGKIPEYALQAIWNELQAIGPGHRYEGLCSCCGCSLFADDMRRARWMCDRCERNLP